MCDHKFRRAVSNHPMQEAFSCRPTLVLPTATVPAPVFLWLGGSIRRGGGLLLELGEGPSFDRRRLSVKVSCHQVESLDLEEAIRDSLFDAYTRGLRSFEAEYVQ